MEFRFRMTVPHWVSAVVHVEMAEEPPAEVCADERVIGALALILFALVGMFGAVGGAPVPAMNQTSREAEPEVFPMIDQPTIVAA